ncbi:MAG: hypothetical protein RL223_3202 [Pseudomonadota bacterium]|jgi:ubiquinone biosynthesis UbiH/UbiF/VisC/COQ6 family hydroxylase
MTSCDVCIRGAGAVGLALALALSRQGLRVGLVPAASAAGSGGGGGVGLAEPTAPDLRTWALNRQARALLQQLKVWDALPADAVTAVEDMAVAGDAEGARIGFSAWQQGVDALAWIVDAGELERALRAAVRFAPHVAVLPADARVRVPGLARPVGPAGEGEGGATAAAGPRVEAGLLVLAEGKDSAGRAALGVGFERHGYGQSALAARLRAERPHGGLARQWFQSPDVLALLPFDRPQPGHGYGLVWSLPPERAAELAAADPAAFEAALMEATGGAAGPLRLVGERAVWPLAIGHARPVCGAGWVLVGDAAHQVHPLAGQGLNLGLADVSALAAVLAAREPWRALGDERLLRRHERARAWPVTAMAGLTDGLQRLFALPGAAPKELRNRGLTLLDRLAPLKRVLAGQAFGD